MWKIWGLEGPEVNHWDTPQTPMGKGPLDPSRTARLVCVQLLPGKSGF